MALVNEARMREIEMETLVGPRELLDESHRKRERDLCETVRALREGLSDALDLSLGDFVENEDEEPQNEEHREYRRLKALWDSVS